MAKALPVSFDLAESLERLRQSLESFLDGDGGAPLSLADVPHADVLMESFPDRYAKALRRHLAKACLDGKAAHAKTLVGAGADPSVPEHLSWNEQTVGHHGPERPGRHPCAYAILRGDMPLLKTLVQSGADPSLSRQDNLESFWGLARDAGWAHAIGFMESVSSLFPGAFSPSDPKSSSVWLMIGHMSKIASKKPGDKEAFSEFVKRHLGDPMAPNPGASDISFHLFEGGMGSGGLPQCLFDFKISSPHVGDKTPPGTPRAWQTLSRGMEEAEPMAMSAALRHLDREWPPGAPISKTKKHFPSDDVHLDKVSDTRALDPDFHHVQRDALLDALKSSGRTTSGSFLLSLARRAAWRGQLGILEACLDLGADPKSIAEHWREENVAHGALGGRAAVVNRRALAECSMELAARVAIHEGPAGALSTLEITQHSFLLGVGGSQKAMETFVSETMARASSIEARLLSQNSPEAASAFPSKVPSA